MECLKKMKNCFERFTTTEHEIKEFPLGQKKELSLDDIARAINFPGTKNHKIEYESVLEIEPPKSNSPKDISKFLWNTFENQDNYSIAKPEIKETIIYKGQKTSIHQFRIKAVYDPKQFNKLKHFSAIVKFKYN